MNSYVTGGPTMQQSNGVPRSGGESFSTNIHTANSRSSKTEVMIGNHHTTHSWSIKLIDVEMVQLTTPVKVTFTVSLQVNPIPCYKNSTVHCPSTEHNTRLFTAPQQNTILDCSLPLNRTQYMPFHNGLRDYKHL